MRIIQLTDLHIYPTDELIYEVDTRGNFLNILKEIKELEFDMLVITGDLCFSDGDTFVYKWIKKQLDSFKITNYHIIGGNHDDANALARIFDTKKHLHKDELYYFIEPNFIFLDTIKGFCSENQLNWFKEKIITIKDGNPVIFMHHPPFLAGVKHMDKKYSFKQQKQFSEICNENDETSFVFCGHYHNEISLSRDNINMYITPSTYLQIYMYSEDFEVDHRYPAYRIIDIKGKQIRTTVRYRF